MKKVIKSVTTPASPAPSPAKTKKSAASKPAAKAKTSAQVAAIAAAKAKPSPVEAVVVSAKPKKAPARKKAVASPLPVPVAVDTAPLAKAPIATLATTVVTAQIDVGFGNTLYLRGEGPGLSWEKGVALDCVADDKWSFVFTGVERPVVFKFLLNDLTWSLGEDYIAAPGATVTVSPAF